MVAFDYKYLPVNELQVVTKEDQKTGKQTVDHLLVHDEPLQTSERFWTSLFARFGVSKSIFTYFDYREVFQRISDRATNDRLRVCVERNDKSSKDQLLSVSNPANPVVLYPELVDLLEKYDWDNINYANGIVESTHTPRVPNNFDVGGDLFSNRFVMSTPVDGYGLPATYLSMLRLICSNGMIGYAPSFKTSLKLGKGADDVRHTIGRTLDGFNSDDGYTAMRHRMEASTKSWLSVNESLGLRKILVRAHNNAQLIVNEDRALTKAPGLSDWVRGDVKGSPVTAAFENMTGDTSRLYGLADLNALSIKRQRTLPVKCTVYDAMNFATEVATHYSKPEGARSLNAWVGELISDEYDMENTKDKISDFADFHVSQKLAVPELTGSKN